MFSLRLRPCRSFHPHDFCSRPQKQHSKQRQITVKTEKSDQEAVIYKGIVGVAIVGCCETVYLTLSKLLHTSLLCPSSGCDSVVNSAYSEIYGVPLPLLGLVGYGAVGVFASECLSERRSVFTQFLLVSSASLMASCSGVLVFTIVTKLGGAVCLWCYLSAFLSFSTAALSLTTLGATEKIRIVMPSGAMAFLAAFALFTVFEGVDDTAIADDIVLEYAVPAVTESSTQETIALAKRLRSSGVRMYGAFWCSHCLDQKQAFGKQAMKEFPYVECFPNGYRKGVKVANECSAVKIQGYPTWIFGEKRVAGEQSLEALEAELTELEASAANILNTSS